MPIAFVPFYATGFRGDQFAEALSEIAAVSMRYGATEYDVYRHVEDRYKFSLYAHFDDKTDFERYWYGDDFNHWRAVHSGWYQVPVVYGFVERLGREEIGPQRAGDSAAPAVGA